MKGGKRSGGMGGAEEELARAPLQAILLANSFDTDFQPITLQRPKVLLPLVNAHMIDYTLAWLESAGVEQVFVFCCAHSKQVIDYLHNFNWSGQPNITKNKQLLYYEDGGDNLRGYLSLDKAMLTDNNSSMSLHSDKQDCYTDICSPEVLSLFTDNFDYQHLRHDFVKGLFNDDIMGYKIFTQEIHSSYAARIDNYRSYSTVSKYVIQRWMYPLVPDIQFFGNSSNTKLERQGTYRAPEVQQSRSAKIGPFTVIGTGTSIRDNTNIPNSAVGEGCTIGSNITIEATYKHDSNDKELERYADYSSGVTEMPSMSGTLDKLNEEQRTQLPDSHGGALEPDPTTNDSYEDAEDIRDAAARRRICADALSYSVMKLVLDTPHIKLVDVEYSPLFSRILKLLGDNGIIQEDAILDWVSGKEGAEESDKIFVRQSEELIQLLREAPEEED
ncbi:hypothetical protein HAX54_008336 [Datura stramonium]|uniref:Translation initiation factor eIF2B subunit epsilon n=1 Tax=Datura stramonium TaxID=4076 RepID=A0ABS8TEX3_DATST|nr:hypothetical protein [Datura stramonium]